jgi:hypothetical protein
MNVMTNGKTEIGPVDFEFEAARQAIENLMRKLSEHEYHREASMVSGMIRDLDIARERYSDPL